MPKGTVAGAKCEFNYCNSYIQGNEDTSGADLHIKYLDPVTAMTLGEEVRKSDNEKLYDLYNSYIVWISLFK